MSMSVSSFNNTNSNPTTGSNDYFQGFWARIFGEFIRSAREKAGLSIENAAELAGMDPRNWLAVEAGSWLPTSRQQFQFMAAALDMSWETMADILLLCRGVWGAK